MKRFSLAPAAAISSLCVAAALLTTGLFPALASAEELELGTTETPVTAPVCPPSLPSTKCDIVLTEVTAFETIRDGVAYPTMIRKAGEIVAFSLGVSALSTNKKSVAADVAYLNSAHGGTPQAALTVLRPVGARGNFRWAVAAESLPIQLLPYLGEVAQFPLLQPLPVVPGEILAITVPTWAPLLSIDLTASKFAYRQSRSTGCPTISTAVLSELTIGDAAGYKCDYRGSRMEYSATEITSPTPTR